MSYEPTNWKTGDVVTSAKLNKLEQGVASGAMIVTGYNTISGNGTLNKTWQEIYDAASQGKSVVLVDEQEIGGDVYKAALPLRAVSINTDNAPPVYYVAFDNQMLQCNSADAYPTSGNAGGGGGFS